MKDRLVMGFLAASLAASAEDEGVKFFREQVKPILEENCFKCHGGADDKGHPRVRGGLQLISRKGLMKGGDHGPAFHEGAPAESILLEALSYRNEDLQMPPKGKLADEQIEKVRKWLEMGAPWTPEDADVLVEVHDPLAGVTTVNEKTLAHWSYKAMERPEVPKVADEEWNGNPIDAFLKAHQDSMGLKPAPEANRAALLRRLSYDLTGLPPSVEEIWAFEQDASPEAWQKQVERLLASPHYGEKWARHWLDVVRYGESNGFERDSDKPFAWRYRDYVIRAFNEDKPYDRFLTEQIAGDELPDRTSDSMIATSFFRLMPWDDEPADRKQHFFDVLDDNVRTVTEGFMAMTAGCARCHDHKGDPIPQADYFKFVSFFRGIEPMGHQTTMIQTPDLEGKLSDQVEVWKGEKAKVDGRMAAIEKAALEAFSRSHPEEAAKVRNETAGGSWLLTDARIEPSKWYYTIERPADDWSAVGFRAELAGWKQGVSGFGSAAPGVQGNTPWNSPDIWLQTTFGLQEMPEDILLHLYHDEDVEIFLNGQPVLRRQNFVTSYQRIRAPRAFMAALQTGRNVLAVHVKQSAGGQFFDLGVQIGGITPREVVLRPAWKAVEEPVRNEYRELAKRSRSLSDLIERPGLEAMVITESGRTPPPTLIHIRGSAHAEGDEVKPGFPVIWGGGEATIEPPAISPGTSGRRLALAKWMTKPDHPRTARVMVNRIWQHHFGRGISPTPNDFGFLGIAPTHPELLDWLATEFVKQGWSVKAIHRLILNSKAYRLSIAEDEEGIAKDPVNDTFRRFNPRRLTAEEIRDSILRATGELNLQMSGPSVYIPMPEEVLATSSTKGGKWGVSPPDQANRRSVYVKIKRSLQSPLFTDFDVADTDNTCPVRFTTTVPTQALAMMNSEFVHEKAAKLAERIRSEKPGDRAAQVTRAFELVLSRPPQETELKRALAFIEEMQAKHALDEAGAMQRFGVAVFSFNEFFYLD